MMDYAIGLIRLDAEYAFYPIATLFVAGIIRWVVHRYLIKWTERTEHKIDDLLLAYADNLIPSLLLLSVLYYLCYWAPFSVEAVGTLRKGVLILAIVLSAVHTGRLASSLIGLLDMETKIGPRFLQPLRILSYILFILLAAAVILKMLQVNLTEEAIRLLRVVGILAGAYVLVKMIQAGAGQMERLVLRENTGILTETEKRTRTLANVLSNAGYVLVVGIAIMIVLSEFGINIAPIITGAGIVGLAVGFGAQNLVRDVISGFFLILEDQIRVGDVAKINGIGGLVEAIRLRTTTLRDLEGTVHFFQNGEIKQVANLTKEISYCVIDVGVAYKENIDRVIEVLRSVGQNLVQDPDFHPLILAPLEILGVDELGSSQVTIKIRIKTVPLQQWTVGRELRKRIKNAFDSTGIEIPFPQICVSFHPTTVIPNDKQQGGSLL